MIVQFNTDNNLSGDEKHVAPFIDHITESLSRFSKHLTRVEVHLSDENGKKGGADDIRCLMEARVEGKSPIAVTNFSSTQEQAVSGAISKLKASLDTLIGKSENHH